MDADTEKQILDELRSQTTLLKSANKANWIGIASLSILVVIVLASVALRGRIAARCKDSAASGDSWSQARACFDNDDFAKGKEISLRLIAKHPDYYYGYKLLGAGEQRLGNLQEAESNYAKAYDLFPTEDNEKDLVAMRKAIEKKNSTMNKASDAIGAEAAPQHQH